MRGILALALSHCHCPCAAHACMHCMACSMYCRNTCALLRSGQFRDVRGSGSERHQKHSKIGCQASLPSRNETELELCGGLNLPAAHNLEHSTVASSCISKTICTYDLSNVVGFCCCYWSADRCCFGTNLLYNLGKWLPFQGH